MRLLIGSILLALIICVSGFKVHELPQVNSNSYEKQWLDVKLNHFDDSDTRTFSLRYYINKDHWTPDSDVVVLYVCGEQACYAPSSSQFPQQMGADLNALLLAVEHRYYGASQPFTDAEGGWSTENLQYLNSKQALADLAFFIDTINGQLQEQGITQKQRWIVVGGSYPGALVAWFKSKYPDHAYIAYSSSGVIKAIEDYTDYDLDLYLSTLRSGEECPNTLQALTQYADRIFQDAKRGESLDEYKKIKELFKAEEVADVYFMSFLANVVAGQVQYGGRSSLCKFVLSIADKSEYELLEAFHEYTGDIPVSAYNVDSMKDTNVNRFSIGRQWEYQVCHEFGWFQTPNPTSPMRSPLLDMPFQIYQCSEWFDGYQRPDVEGINNYYGGLDIQGEKIIFANSVEDPWQYAAMRTIHDPATQSGMTAVYIDCDDCAHCSDLGSPSKFDPTALTEARQHIYDQILQWLDEDEEKAPINQTTFLQ